MYLVLVKVSGSFVGIIAFIGALIGLVVYSYVTAPPLSVGMKFVGVDNTTFIYVIYVMPRDSPYWDSHNVITIYAVNTYTGNIAVNCIVKPQPPIIITKNEDTLFITLFCPMAITNTTITVNNKTMTITPPGPFS